jgi:hypothetical protein
MKGIIWPRRKILEVVYAVAFAASRLATSLQQFGA